MKEKEFDALVNMMEKRLLKEEYLPIHYSLTVSGYNNEDIELVISKALQNLTGCDPHMNGLVCAITAFLLEMKISIGDDAFSGLNFDYAWEAAKLLFYEKAKTSTQALVLSKKD